MTSIKAVIRLIKALPEDINNLLLIDSQVGFFFNCDGRFSKGVNSAWIFDSIDDAKNYMDADFGNVFYEIKLKNYCEVIPIKISSNLKKIVSCLRKYTQDERFVSDDSLEELRAEAVEALEVYDYER